MKKTSHKHTTVPPQIQRSADRFDTELPVEIGGISSLTRNISATGMYIETDTHLTTGSHVQFTVEVVVRGQNLKLVCEGEVVRVEQKGDTTGVAIKLDKSFFSDIE
ncbi:MAG: PilZ domain-containing protein [Rhodoferax sp.]|uniref:PilZ domain-containing protein n=1 Tax=Rhodoferax sp. TaxID=50421 RepID=UPI0026116347|nr:PilZ domain-containing protein [Rhodoferax sp.]MDD2881475.1 PilZ domain-containing protein [Rhodoferax sp.]